MNICYLVGAGDFIGSFKPGETDLVIAADGGFDSLKRLGIRCDLLVGDCDSIENIPEKIALIRHPERKGGQPLDRPQNRRVLWLYAAAPFQGDGL